jgi:hypothetical protein
MSDGDQICLAQRREIIDRSRSQSSASGGSLAPKKIVAGESPVS